MASSGLRKPCWISEKRLSPKSKKCPVLENDHNYIRSNRMRNLHVHSVFMVGVFLPKASQMCFVAAIYLMGGSWWV